MAPLPLINPPLQDSDFTLDISGVAGLFGGDEVVEATSSLHLYKGRKYRGWYNSPGAYVVAKYFGRIADSRFWRGVFPGEWQDPADAFSLDGKKGPKYQAVLSGTQMITGHTGYLLGKFIREQPGKDLREANQRTTEPTGVTIVDIKSVKNLDNLFVPSSLLQLLVGYFTIFSSFAAAIISLILFDDRICFAAIVIGTMIGGISSLVIGTGNLTLHTVYTPAPGSPPGDGILIDKEVIILRGSEAHVNAITKGRFVLDLIGKPKYHIIGVCAALYFAQFIAQLFLIPLGSLGGQIMFLASFAVAYVNNSLLASIDRDAIQTRLLLQSVDLKYSKFKVPNRTMATIFACLALKRSKTEINECPAYADYRPEEMLRSLLPNDTTVWNTWREVVLDVLHGRKSEAYFADALNDPRLADLRTDQRNLLRTLLLDARAGYIKYQEFAKGTIDGELNFLPLPSTITQGIHIFAEQCVVSSSQSFSDEKA
ncbi:hypothetical protein CVT26_004693 [Gymnopilus dilepis]|uniref:Uncharacterized protein n=1 Tax=Gymnopilus dilepis TaxID=231916 RepID=A0A409XZB8_9AGAR|nr:hypothetical protein CVT26_004693 [Gymnopilus dilepis]